MINPCQPFGYGVEEAMKIFTIVEMFIAFFHVIISTEVLWIVGEFNSITNKPFRYTLMMILHIIFFITLIIQAVCGFLLHFVGYKNRNVTICMIWLVIACINFFMPWLILIFFAILLDDTRYWSHHYLYLFYLIIGTWIVFLYMKSAKGSSGRAVAPANAPSQSQSKTTHSKAPGDDPA